MTPYRAKDYVEGWAYQMHKNDIPHLGRPLSSRYSIRYNPKIKHNCLAFNRPGGSGNSRIYN